MKNSDKLSPIDSAKIKFNLFMDDQLNRSEEKSEYGIIVEEGSFERILDTIKKAPKMNSLE